MEVFLMFAINDLYGYKNYSFLNKLLEGVITKLKLDNAIFSIVFVDDEKMREINKKYRNKDETTDVLSFAFEDNENIKYNEFRVLGDIYISIPKMQAQALEYEHSEKKELAFLVVHGLLHLLGYDHMTDQEEKEMFTLQEALLNEKI
ncbi:MAG: rRNA maturation RNase YbeY [Mollicutes bacterium]|jgi:probable rRNA maturation factor|nr:rRNA maturation RNase YbeY [Mollicutes bacterium]